MPAAPRLPQTRAESSRYSETSRHADVLRFLAELEKRRDPRLARLSFGTSPEGRELPLLVLSASGIQTPEEALEAELPVVLVINGIHAGEVEGKEASMMLVRDLLSSAAGDVLERVTLVVVPLFNPDGNDRISPENRRLDLAKLEGQLGPESGVGTRGNSTGINLNRDYLRQAAPEMRALQSKVCRPWQPHLTIDCHSTNGSVHRFAMTYDVPHTVESGRREPILYARDRLLPAVRAAVRTRTGLDSFFYGNFTHDEGRSENGWITYTHHPRFGSNYRGLTNRMDVLLEAYSYLEFEERVRTTYEFLAELLAYSAEHGREMVEIVESSQHPPEKVAVRYRLETFPEPVEILTREPRTLEGSPTSVILPHFGRFTGAEVVARPWGYALPSAVATHLALHGLSVKRLAHAGKAMAEVARVERVERAGSRKILESTDLGELVLDAAYDRRALELPEGTAFVATDQPLGAIAVYLCEAKSDDSLWINGLLDEPARGDELSVVRLLEPLAG